MANQAEYVVRKPCVVIIGQVPEVEPIVDKLETFLRSNLNYEHGMWHLDSFPRFFRFGPNLT
jgi:hypothetical protein